MKLQLEKIKTWANASFAYRGFIFVVKNLPRFPLKFLEKIFFLCPKKIHFRLDERVSLGSKVGRSAKVNLSFLRFFFLNPISSLISRKESSL